MVRISLTDSLAKEDPAALIDFFPTVLQGEIFSFFGTNRKDLKYLKAMRNGGGDAFFLDFYKKIFSPDNESLRFLAKELHIELPPKNLTDSTREGEIFKNVFKHTKHFIRKFTDICNIRGFDIERIRSLSFNALKRLNDEFRYKSFLTYVQKVLENDERHLPNPKPSLDTLKSLVLNEFTNEDLGLLCRYIGFTGFAHIIAEIPLKKVPSHSLVSTCIYAIYGEHVEVIRALLPQFRRLSLDQLNVIYKFVYIKKRYNILKILPIKYYFLLPPVQTFFYMIFIFLTLVLCFLTCFTVAAFLYHFTGLCGCSI